MRASLVVLLLSLPVVALAEEWVKVYEGKGLLRPSAKWRTSYDKDSLKAQGDGFRKVWTKRVCLSGCAVKDENAADPVFLTYSLQYVLYDCEQDTMTNLSGQNFWDDGTATKQDEDKESDPIPPGFMDDAVLKAVCGED